MCTTVLLVVIFVGEKEQSTFSLLKAVNIAR